MQQDSGSSPESRINTSTVQTCRGSSAVQDLQRSILFNSVKVKCSLMDLSLLVANYVLGVLPPAELPFIAEQMIADGMEPASLTRLMLDVDSSIDVRQAVFERSMAELGQPLPNHTNAAITAATQVAKDILSEAVSPYDGATYCWKVIFRNLDRVPDELWAFKSNASAIEDCYADAEQFGSNHEVLIATCTKEIVDACLALVQAGSSR